MREGFANLKSQFVISSSGAEPRKNDSVCRLGERFAENLRFTGCMNSSDESLPKIHVIRGLRVVLDADLATLFEVPTKRLNEAVRRNAEKFPPDFLFSLTREEVANLKSQFATSSLHGGRRKPVAAFTEHGALMAGTVLNSPRAVQMSLYLVKAFVRMREALTTNVVVLQRLSEIDRKLLQHDVVLRDVYEKLRPLLDPPPPPQKPKIGFNRSES